MTNRQQSFPVDGGWGGGCDWGSILKYIKVASSLLIILYYSKLGGWYMGI